MPDQPDLNNPQTLVIEQLKAIDVHHIVTIDEITGGKLAKRMIRILGTEWDTLDEKTKAEHSILLKEFIRNASYIMQQDPDPDSIEYEEPAHAFFWRGLARLKLNDEGGHTDLYYAYIMYEHWKAIDFDTIWDNAHDKAEAEYGKDYPRDRVDQIHDEMEAKLEREMEAKIEEWKKEGSYKCPKIARLAE